MSDIKLTCLLVDDEQELLESLSFFLEQMQIDCVSANGGYEAFEILEKMAKAEELPQFILSDINMPEGDGVWLLNRIIESHSPALTRLPLFFMTAFPEWSEAELKEKGAYGLFRKPFSVQDIIKIVRESLK